MGIGKCGQTVVLGLLVGCNASSAPGASAVHLDGGMSGEGGAASVCPAAIVVADSDYTSTNISVLDPSGAMLSQSVLSSGSAVPGLSAALSGDIVLPLARSPGTIVLIDQFPNAVITWLDPSTASVIHQLNVGTGFSSNPHDYVEVTPTKAYVTRYESNMSAGAQPNDGGGDLLIVNPQTATVTGRVAFAPEGAFLPRPDRMMRVGDDVWVSLERWDATFTTAGDARLAGVATADDSIGWTLDLSGVANCTGVARAPSGKVVALSCSGVSGDTDPLARSAVVLLDATARPPTEMKRFAATSLLGTALGYTIDFASESLLVGVLPGDKMAKRNDVAYALDLNAGAARMLIDAGAAFVLGDVRCLPGCGDLCFIADANANALRIWKAGGSSLDPRPSVPVDPAIGLPPRSLGAF